MTVLEIVSDVVKRFEALGLRYALGGSLASSIWGQMRQTNDADIVLRLPRSFAPALKEAFASPYLISGSEIEAALESTEEFRTVQVLHMDEAFKIDLFLLRDGEFEATELDRARIVTVAPGIAIRVYAPENIVIAKLRWYKVGNRVSDRQWNDIVQVLEVQRGQLDEAYLDQWASHFGVRDLLEQARGQVVPPA
ncbi:MAG: hypothetical protein ACO1SV_18455 [Fimbriimonas sp.]